MHKLTRKERELIRQLANQLPKTFYEANEVHNMKGSAILADNAIDTSKFKGPIHPEKMYVVNVPTKHYVNHNNRLITAFESGGMVAVDEYCQGVLELIDNQFKTKGVIPAEMATC